MRKSFGLQVRIFHQEILRKKLFRWNKSTSNQFNTDTVYFFGLINYACLFLGGDWFPRCFLLKLDFIITCLEKKMSILTFVYLFTWVGLITTELAELSASRSSLKNSSLLGGLQNMTTYPLLEHLFFHLVIQDSRIIFPHSECGILFFVCILQDKLYLIKFLDSLSAFHGPK